ncbi:MAG: tRNA (adenosine(37)-N6)-threonylcarbamoyltransferase complex ATPase subunit type 1 TsaE [Elusimicrobia bacterium RIFOXYA2_FULL_39_19]|nr:MAG: tRNA (adenosine(37)-N6)-threonylcarbamoyltransferase complex ATPase subunit type 1 TsaE [Elusimicrobia bacterium RIFOXYA2_FULL_39_19]
MQIGRELVKNLKKGDIICLSGELGAGKTTLVKGIARGLKIENDILSPTFVLVREYPIKNDAKFCHIDLYRINEPQFFDSGMEQYFTDSNICAVEWPERIKGMIPKRHIKIEMKSTKNNSRKIVISYKGYKQ